MPSALDEWVEDQQQQSGPSELDKWVAQQQQPAPQPAPKPSELDEWVAKQQQPAPAQAAPPPPPAKTPPPVATPPQPPAQPAQEPWYSGIVPGARIAAHAFGLTLPGEAPFQKPAPVAPMPSASQAAPSLHPAQPPQPSAAELYQQARQELQAAAPPPPGEGPQIRADEMPPVASIYKRTTPAEQVTFPAITSRGKVVPGEPKPQYMTRTGQGYTPPPETGGRTPGQELQDFLFSPPQSVRAALAELNQVMVGPYQIIQKGIVEPAVTTATTPAALLATAAGAGAGAMATSGAASVAAAGKAANAAMSAYFASESFRSMVQQSDEAYRLYGLGRYWDALASLAGAGTSGAFAYLAGMHAHGELSDLETLAATKRVLQDRLNAEERMRRAEEERKQAMRPKIPGPKPEGAPPPPEEQAPPPGAPPPEPPPQQEVQRGGFGQGQPQRAGVVPPPVGQEIQRGGFGTRGVIPPPVGQPAPPLQEEKRPATIEPYGPGAANEPGGEGGGGADLQGQRVPLGGVGAGTQAGPQEPLGGTHGRGAETEVHIPGTRVRLGARYDVVPLDTVVPSHHPFSFQPNPEHPFSNERAYETPEAQSRVIDQTENFEHRYLVTDNPDNVNGPPVVTTDPQAAGKPGEEDKLFTLGGSSRAMTAHRVAQLYPQRYAGMVDYMKQRLPMYGVDPAKVDQIQAQGRLPLLVRVLNPEEAPRAIHIISQLNKTGTAAMSAAEQAVSDSRRVSPDTLNYVSAKLEQLGEGGSLAQVWAGDGGPETVQRLVNDGIITDRERPQYLDQKTNTVTPEGKMRLTRLMTGRFFSNPVQYEAMPQAIRTKLERIAAPLVRLEGRPDWDFFNQPIREALNVIHTAQLREIHKYEELNAQGNLLGQKAPFSPEAIAWAYALNNNSAKTIGDAFRKYAEMENLSRPGETPDMFAPPPVPVDQAYREAIAPLKAGKLNKKRLTIGEMVPSPWAQQVPPVASRRANIPPPVRSLAPQGRVPGEVSRHVNQEEGTAAVITRTRDGFGVQLIDTDDGQPLSHPRVYPNRAAAEAHAQDLVRQGGLMGKEEMRQAMQQTAAAQQEQERLSRPQFGQPARPRRPKPAEQRGLFEEPGPEQEGLGLFEQREPEQAPPQRELTDEERRKATERHPFRQQKDVFNGNPDNPQEVGNSLRFYDWFSRDLEAQGRIDEAEEARRSLEKVKDFARRRFGQAAVDKMMAKPLTVEPRRDVADVSEPERPEERKLAPEPRGAASERNMRIADLEAQASRTPEEQAELEQLRRVRAERQAERRTQFERQKTPLFAEQIPERKPEEILQADEERAQDRRELNERFEQSASNRREAVAQAVTPEQLAEMDRKWESFRGPHDPANHADYWLQRYRDVFKKNPMDTYRPGEPWPLPAPEGAPSLAEQAGLGEQKPEEGGPPVRALRPRKRSLKEVQQELHEAGARRAIKASAPEAVQKHRVKRQSRLELKQQLARSPQDAGFYERDTRLADRDLAQAFPDLKTNKAKRYLLKMISASISGNQNPRAEAYHSTRIWAEYDKTGKIPLKQPNGKKWPGRGAAAALQKLQKLLDHFKGEKGLYRFITSTHTPKEIRDVGHALGYTAGTIRKWIAKRERVPGYAVLGPKFSQYFAGIAGLPSEGTPIDVWMARHHYRQLGRLIQKGKAATGPRSEADREMFMQVHRELAKEFDRNPLAIQSLLWHFEQNLYQNLGVRVQTYKRSDGTLKYLEDHGLAPEYVQRRRNAGIRAGGAARQGAGAGRGTGVKYRPVDERGGEGVREGDLALPEEPGQEVGIRARELPLRPRQESFDFGEPDKVTADDTNQAVADAEAGKPHQHLYEVDPTLIRRVPEPVIPPGTPPNQKLEMWINGAQSYPTDFGGTPAVITNSSGMGAIMKSIGDNTNPYLTWGMMLRPHELRTLLSTQEILTRNYVVPGRQMTPYQRAALRAAAIVRRALGLSTVEQAMREMESMPEGSGEREEYRGNEVEGKLLVVGQNGQLDIGNRELKELIEEELDHAIHERLPGGGMENLPKDVTYSPLGKIAAKFLEDRANYPALTPRTAGVITSEILVRLMRTGRYPQLGLTVQQARELALLYRDKLLATHGDNAYAIVKGIKDSVIGYEPAEQQPLFPRRTSGGPGPTGQVGEPGRGGVGTRAGPDVSGIEAQQPPGPTPKALAPKARAAATAAAAGMKKNLPAINKALGISPAIERNVIPAIDRLESIWDWLLKTFNPAARGPAAEKAAYALRANAAHMDRVIKQAGILLNKSRPLLEKLSQADKYEFIRRNEYGQPQATPELQRISDMLSDVNDFIRKEVDVSDPNVQRIWRDVYFPNMWKETSGAKPGVTPPVPPGQGRAPLFGSKSFTKKKIFQDFDEGIANGYTPLFDNPIDFWKVKVREMAKFAMATRLREDVKPMRLFVPFGQKIPPGFAKINDPMGRVFQYSPTEKGMIARGEWVYPEPAANIINNYLSPDPRQEIAPWRLIANLSNLWLRWKLTGFYHFGTTSLNAVYSHAALGLRYLAQGDMRGAIAQAARAPISPVADWIRGRRLMREFLDMGARQNAVFQALEEGGFRAGMDSMYNSGYRDRLKEAWQAGERIMPVKGILAGAEAITAPIMEHYVPYLKMAAAADLARFELDRYQKRNRGMMPTPPRLRKIMADAVDSIDNRFGQLVYDNLLWKRTTKALGMQTIMSLGWNLGTVRELGGGVKDTMAAIADGVRGKPPQFTNKMAYLIAMNALHVLGAILYMKLMTGRNPEEPKDLVFPKDGGYDERGHATRTSFPDYAKDEWSWLNDPWDTATNKLHPFPAFIVRLGLNRDYWGSRIRNKDDDDAQQIGQIGNYFWREEAKPLSISNLQKLKERAFTTPSKMVLSQFGFSPTPAWISMSPAERKLAEYMRDRQPVGGRPIEEQQRTVAHNAILNAMRHGGDTKTVINNAMKQGLVTPRELAGMRRVAPLSPLQSALQHDQLSPDQVMHIWQVATPEERKQIEQFAKRRLMRAAPRASNWTDWARQEAVRQFGVHARPKVQAQEAVQ